MCIMRREYYLRAVVAAVAVSIFLSAFAGNAWAGKVAKLLLKAPHTKALGVYPRDVKEVEVTIEGWRCFGSKEYGPRSIMKIANHADTDERILLAVEILDSISSDDFWASVSFEGDDFSSTVFTYKVPASESFHECYTQKELENMKKTTIAWARATKSRLMKEGKWK